MKQRTRLIDFTWRCGCRMAEDGLNVVWTKCGPHRAAHDLLSTAKDIAKCFPYTGNITARMAANLTTAIAKAEATNV